MVEWHWHQVVRFVENRGAPLAPPASWERLLPLEGKEPEGPQAQAAQETVDAVDVLSSVQYVFYVFLVEVQFLHSFSIT